jgi:nitrate/TMAO reductase-like tetraheme cytochrome c subunit
MGAIVKDLLAWCRRHLVLVVVLALVAGAGFAYVNIQVLHMTSEPEFCHMCHPGKGFGALAEVDSWEHSGHAEAGVSCLDCHGRPGVVGYMKAKLGGLKDTYMQLTISAEEKLQILENPGDHLVPSEQCIFCHTDEGNAAYRKDHKYTMQIVEMRMLDSVVNPEFRQRKGLPDIMTDNFVGGTHFDHSFHIESFEMECNSCHFGVVHREQSKSDRMNLCLECHAENEGSSAPQLANCQACHEAQYDMNLGKGAKGVAGEESLMWVADVQCDGCHIGADDGQYRPSAESCANCHDEDYVGIFNDWASETKSQMEELNLIRSEIELMLKEADKRERTTTDAWALYEKALYNYRLVRNDGTRGVHNNEYAKAILDTVAADFREIQKGLNEAW